MKELLLDLLADPFGLSKGNLKLLLQVVEDEEGEGEESTSEIDEQITEKKIVDSNGIEWTRFVIE